MFENLWKNVKEFFGVFEDAVKNIEKTPPNPPDLHEIVSRVGKNQEEVGYKTSKAVKKAVKKVTDKAKK